MMEKYYMILESKRNEIQKFEELLDNINKEFNLPSEKFINFQIACSEAIINAIVHGNKEQENKRVYIEIVFDNQIMMIKIKDEGNGFDINSLPDPTKSENLFKESGRGIFIIKSLVDEFDCSSSNNGTEYILKVKK